MYILPVSYMEPQANGDLLSLETPAHLESKNDLKVVVQAVLFE